MGSMPDTRSVVPTLDGLDPGALAQLFEEVTRATEDLASSHDSLLGEVARLKEELAVKNRRLERKKRLEAIGRVAAGVAHEFRNPLGGIRLYADQIRKAPRAEKSVERVDQILAAVTHLDHIVEDLLTYTRNQSLERSPQSMSELVEAAVSLAYPDVSALEFELLRQGPEDLEVHVDRVAFVQVLMNLLTNAQQAVGQLPEARVGLWWGTRAGSTWVEVADTGHGIPAGEEEKIFHPFHTLRQEGTGLGLAIVQSRVEAHEGEIAVVRQAWGGMPEWSGARFRITLPQGMTGG